MHCRVSLICTWRIGELQERDSRISSLVTDVWRLVIRRADTLMSLQWQILVLTLRLAVYTLFWENKIKFGQKVFCIPKNMHSHTPMVVPRRIVSFPIYFWTFYKQCLFSDTVEISIVSGWTATTSFRRWRPSADTRCRVTVENLVNTLWSSTPKWNLWVGVPCCILCSCLYFGTSRRPMLSWWYIGTLPRRTALVKACYAIVCWFAHLFQTCIGKIFFVSGYHENFGEKFLTRLWKTLCYKQRRYHCLTDYLLRFVVAYFLSSTVQLCK